MKTPEHILERNRQWRARNPEKANQSSVNWQKKNWERHLEYVRNWNKANRASRNISEGKWKAKNPEKVKAVILNWREKNKERYRLIKSRSWHRYRDKARNAKPCDKASANVLCQLVSSAFKLKCGICGKNMPKNDRTIDHVIPLSKGGSGEIWNLRIVHMVCNARKHAKMPDELNFTP